MSCVWNPNLLIGNAQLDDQHRMLFRLMDELLIAISEGKGQELVVRILATLSISSSLHYKLEEELMDKFGYADLDAHRKSHDVLKGQINHMVDRFHDEGLDKQELIDFMQDWLGNHIQKADKHFVDFMRSSEQAAS